MNWKQKKSIAVSIGIVVVAFLGLILACSIIKAASLAALPNDWASQADGIAEKFGFALVLVSITLATKSSESIGLRWPVNWDGVIALSMILVCFGGIVTFANGGIDRPISSIGLQIFLLTLISVMLTGCWEELFYRGFALRQLAPCGIIGSLTVSSLLFAVVHVRFGGNTLTLLSNLLPSFSLGLLFSVNRMQTGSLLPVMCVHAAHNLFHSLFFGDSAQASGHDTDSGTFLLYLLLPLPILAYCFHVIHKKQASWADRYARVNPVEQSGEPEPPIAREFES